MVKRKKIRAGILIGCSVAIVLALCAIPISIWYDVFDITGLTLYQGEPVKEIVLSFQQVYLITEDGRGYVAGGYSGSNSRKYRNSEFHRDEKLGTPSPVLFYDGRIKTLLPILGSGDVFFITAENGLYEMRDFGDIRWVADNVVTAARSIDKSVYFVNLDGYLCKEKDGQIRTLLQSNVKHVATFREQVFVLFANGELCELISDTQLSEPLYRNVKSFQVVDTAETPQLYKEGVILLNVLTNDGELYAKGTYNVSAYGETVSGVSPSPIIFEDWTLLGENVVSFSMAPMGTIMKNEEGGCVYAGFDTVLGVDTAFQTYTLQFSSIERVYANQMSVILIDNQKHCYIWGYGLENLLLQINGKTYNYRISLDEPYVLDLS